MQTFSNMRRSGSFKDTLSAVSIFAGLYVYISITNMNVWFPPLIGLCFVLFTRFNRQNRFYYFLAVVGCIICIESEKYIPLGSLLALYTGLFVFVVPRLSVILSTIRLERISYVIIAYLALYIASLCVGAIIGSDISYNIWLFVYYAIIEIILVLFI